MKCKLNQIETYVNVNVNVNVNVSSQMPLTFAHLNHISSSFQKSMLMYSYGFETIPVCINTHETTNLPEPKPKYEIVKFIFNICNYYHYINHVSTNKPVPVPLACARIEWYSLEFTIMYSRRRIVNEFHL